MPGESSRTGTVQRRSSWRGDIEKPLIGDTGVLVRVQAASIHIGD